ncbi:MAG: cupin domain-containing protein [Planctomycetota bacterium]
MQTTETCDAQRATPETIRRDWDRAGFTCELWIDPPQHVEELEHDVDARIYLSEGSCLIEFDSHSVRLEAGSQMAIPAGVRHTVRNCGTGRAHWLHGFPA